MPRHQHPTKWPTGSWLPPGTKPTTLMTAQSLSTFSPPMHAGGRDGSGLRKGSIAGLDLSVVPKVPGDRTSTAREAGSQSSGRCHWSCSDFRASHCPDPRANTVHDAWQWTCCFYPHACLLLKQLAQEICSFGQTRECLGRGEAVSNSR